MKMDRAHWAHVFRNHYDRYGLADLVIAALSEDYECSCYNDQYLKEKLESLEQHMKDYSVAIDSLQQYITQVDEKDKGGPTGLVGDPV